MKRRARAPYFCVVVNANMCCCFIVASIDLCEAIFRRSTLPSTTWWYVFCAPVLHPTPGIYIGFVVVVYLRLFPPQTCSAHTSNHLTHTHNHLTHTHKRILYKRTYTHRIVLRGTRFNFSRSPLYFCRSSTLHHTRPNICLDVCSRWIVGGSLRYLYICIYQYLYTFCIFIKYICTNKDSVWCWFAVILKVFVVAPSVHVYEYMRETNTCCDVCGSYGMARQYVFSVAVFPKMVN